MAINDDVDEGLPPEDDGVTPTDYNTKQPMPDEITLVAAPVPGNKQPKAEELFGSAAIRGEVPNLNAEFVIFDERSDEADEVQAIKQGLESGGVSQEDIKEALPLVPGLVNDRATLGMFTKHKSRVMYAHAIEQMDVKLDAIYQELRASSLQLADRVKFVGDEFVKRIDSESVLMFSDLNKSINDALEFLGPMALCNLSYVYTKTKALHCLRDIYYTPIENFVTIPDNGNGVLVQDRDNPVAFQPEVSFAFSEPMKAAILQIYDKCNKSTHTPAGQDWRTLLFVDQGEEPLAYFGPYNSELKETGYYINDKGLKSNPLDRPKNVYRQRPSLAEIVESSSSPRFIDRIKCVKAAIGVASERVVKAKELLLKAEENPDFTIQARIDFVRKVGAEIRGALNEMVRYSCALEILFSLLCNVSTFFMNIRQESDPQTVN